MCPGKRLCRRFGLGRQIGVTLWPKLNSYLGQAGFRPSPRARGGRFDVRPPLPCRPLRRLGTRLANRPSADRAIDPTSGFRGGISLGSVDSSPRVTRVLGPPPGPAAGLDAGNVAFARQGRRPGPLLPCVPIPCSRVPNMTCRRARGLPGPATGNHHGRSRKTRSLRMVGGATPLILAFVALVFSSSAQAGDGMFDGALLPRSDGFATGSASRADSGTGCDTVAEPDRPKRRRTLNARPRVREARSLARALTPRLGRSSKRPASATSSGAEWRRPVLSLDRSAPRGFSGCGA